MAFLKPLAIDTAEEAPKHKFLLRDSLGAVLPENGQHMPARVFEHIYAVPWVQKPHCVPFIDANRVSPLMGFISTVVVDEYGSDCVQGFDAFAME